jgi:hypothetical protein
MAIIRNNSLLNSKITPCEELHAEAIFGKDLEVSKEKTRKFPDSFISDYIYVPDNIVKYNKTVVLVIDIMIEKVNSKSAPTLSHEIIKVASLYKRIGFKLIFSCVRTSLKILEQPCRTLEFN